MVSILLSGGLGNQMFQYAAAKSLAKRLHTEFYVDLYSFTKNGMATFRNYELDIFDTNIKRTEYLINKLIYKSFPYLFANKTGNKILNALNVFHDLLNVAVHYKPEFEHLKGNVLLFGYFQNEKYFKDIATELRFDFRFKNNLEGENIIIAEKISQTNSVSLHIRRGDYLSQKTNLNLLDKTYYLNAIKLIEQKVKNPEFFVFSDDIDWVKQNLDNELKNLNYIDWNTGKHSYIDMQLMSLCKHNIIANSSFSWWGAWLNNHQDKIVIAPQQWYQQDDNNRFITDFIPEGWLKL